MLNFYNKTNKTFQKGSAILIVIGTLLIITAVALGVFNGIVPKTTVEVEAPKTKAEQKSPVKQTKTSFGAVQGLTKNLLNLNSEVASRSLTQEEKDLKLSNLVGAAKQRKVLIKELMRENPRAFLVAAIKKNQRSLFPVSVQKDTEQETVIIAKIEVLHIDDFKNPENSRFEYFLRTKDAKLNFYPTNELYLISGAEVKINGFQLDDVVVSDINKQNFQITKEAPPLESVGDQKTLVLLVNFLDSPPIPFTKEQAYDIIFNGQFQKFYEEQSYNQVSFSGDVIDWYKINKNIGTNNFNGACGSVDINDLEKIVIDNSINLNNYARMLIVPNFEYSSGGCSWVGKIDIKINGKVYRLSQAFVGLGSFDGDNAGSALGHEMGHSLGLMHANGWDCGEQILYGESCQHVEYGNRFDIMGVGLYSLHFNAFHKELLGWIQPGKALVIDKSGRYTINPLETNEGIKLAKIQLPYSTKIPIPYYLENRRGIGFDSTLNIDNQENEGGGPPIPINLTVNQRGLFVYNIKFLKSSYLLDLSPTSLLWDIDIRQATLNDQNVFEDSKKGVVVGPIINVDDSSITFDVKIEKPVCVSQKPIVSIFSPFFQENLDNIINVNAGGEVYINFDITNPDSYSCEASEFNLIPILPLGWQYDIHPPENTILFPEEFGAKSIHLTVPAETITGDYSVKFEIINIRSGLKTSKDVIVKVAPPLIISAINPDKGMVGTEVTIFGLGFNYQSHTRFYNQKGGVFISDIITAPNGSNLRFKIPPMIYIFECDCEILTSIGVYQIAVLNDGAQSNVINFEVIESKPLPQLSITAPKDGDIITPKSKVVIIAEVSDEIKNKTERVEFYVNGKRKCQDKTAPYSCNWQAPKKSGQTYKLQVKAFGNRKQSGVKPIAESEIIKVKAEKSASAKDDTQTKDDVEIDN